MRKNKHTRTIINMSQMPESNQKADQGCGAECWPPSLSYRLCSKSLTQQEVTYTGSYYWKSYLWGRWTVKGRDMVKNKETRHWGLINWLRGRKNNVYFRCQLFSVANLSWQKASSGPTAGLKQKIPCKIRRKPKKYISLRHKAYVM